MFREAKYSSLLWSMTVARNKISISLYLDVIVNIKFSLCQMWLVANMKFMTLSAHVMLVVNSSGPSSGLSSELNIFILMHYTGGPGHYTHVLTLALHNTNWVCHVQTPDDLPCTLSPSVPHQYHSTDTVHNISSAHNFSKERITVLGIKILSCLL